jgi:hypothetical protein
MRILRRKSALVGLGTVAAVAAAVVPAGATPGHRTGGSNNVPCAGGSVTYGPTQIWPPNHKFTTVNLSFAESEASPDGDTLKLTVDSITETDNNGASSSELPGSGQPNPPQGDDWTGVGNSATATDPAAATTSVQLRAERAGSGLGRIYTINVSCSDSGGSNMEMNSGKAMLNVCVPHDQSADSRGFCDAAVAASSGMAAMDV